MKHAGIAGIVVALALLGGVPQVARADQKAVKKIQSANRQAMENFDLLDFETAKKELSTSLTYAKRKRLGKHPVVAQTHLLLGIVELSGFSDEESAFLNFMDALSIEPGIKIPEVYRTAAADKLLAEARDELGDGDSDEPPAATPAREEPNVVVDDSVDCGDVEGLQHTLVDEADAGQDRAVQALVGDDMGRAKIQLYYKPEGTPEWIVVPMRKRGECQYVGVIPGDRVDGDFMYYFVEAANAKGKALATRGSKGSPNIIEIRGGSSGGSGAGGGGYDDENPLGSRGSRSTENGLAGGVTVGTTKLSGVFLSISGGTGGGYVTGDTEQEAQPVGCCVALEMLHIQPELGFVMSGGKTIISIGARIGFPVGADIPGHATAAPAGLLRVRRFTSEKVNLSMALGAGYVRHAVPLVEPTEDGGTKDTTAAGPILAGAGLGYISSLGGPFSFMFEVNALAGIPTDALDLGAQNPSFGLQVDVNFGLLLDI